MNQLKTPAGMLDYDNSDMLIRNMIKNIFVTIFNKHNGNEIETPIVELQDVLCRKIDKDKIDQIYTFTTGSENLGLRYDLTVPLARYIATNHINKLKRYQIGRVYRHESTQSGKIREFIQADFDIVGKYDKMLPEVEIIIIICELMEKLELHNFIIQINHKQLLNKILTFSGINYDNMQNVCSSLDKLDKHDWNYIVNELIVKGTSKESINKLTNIKELSLEELRTYISENIDSDLNDIC